MSINKRLISTGAGAVTCTTDSTDPFGDGYGVALYSLDYDASTAPDGNDYSGTPTNVEFGVGGKINYGARFNGSSSKIDLNSLSTVLDAQSIVSVSFWFKSSSTALSGLFSYRGSASSAVNMLVTLNRSATGDIGLDSSTSGAFVNLGTYNGTYNDDNWHHVVSTINYSTGAFNVYIDKILRITGTNTSLSRGTADKVQLGTNYGAQFINGDLDQVRIFSKALSTDEVDELFVEAPCVYTCTTDTVDYPTTNVAYYKLDNSAEDETGSYDGTESNIEYRLGRFGQAAVFNGSSSYITSNSLPSIGTGDFTFSCWFNQNSGSSQGALFSTTTQWFAANGSVSPKVLMVTDDTVTKKGDTAYSQDTWNHAVFARESGVLKIYQNGTEVFSGAYTDSWDMTQFGIGVARAFGSRVYYFNGSIDQVRIYSTALTSSQVTELYEEKQCYITKDAADPFGDSSSVALYEMENNANDSSGNGNNGTQSNVQFTTTDPIRGVYEASFNGSSSKIALPNVINFATGEHTISAWVNFTDTSTSRFISNLYSGTVPNGSIDFVWIPSSNSINIDFSIGGSNYTNTITSVNSNEWIHIVSTFVNNGTCTAYKNGTSIDTVTAASFTATTYQDLNLGYYARGNDYWSGSLDQVRIFDTALEGDQVFKLYAEGVRETGL